MKDQACSVFLNETVAVQNWRHDMYFIIGKSIHSLRHGLWVTAQS